MGGSYPKGVRKVNECFWAQDQHSTSKWSQKTETHRVRRAGLSPQSAAIFPCIWDGDILALTQLLSIKPAWMLKNVYEYPMVWGCYPALALCFLSEKIIYKSINVLYFDSGKKYHWLIMCSLAELQDDRGLEACARAFMFTFCIFAGKNLVHYLPHGGPETLDKGI